MEPAGTVREVRRRVSRGEGEDRLAALERRLEDLEDLVAAALSTARLDELEQRVDELALMTPTVDDLLQVRLQLARLAGDLAAVDDQQRYLPRRRAAG